MNNEYLMREVLQIQNEYRLLLEELYDEKEKDEFIYVIDEISLFWFSKRKIVELILENISEDFDTFLFTGATFLDVKEKEHYPFVSLGNIHVVDDPLAKYAEAIKMNLNDKFYSIMKKQIILAFEDDLRLLKECFGKVILLPVTVVEKMNNSMVKEGSEKTLVSMFKNELTLQDIFKIESLSELITTLKDGIAKQIIFLEDEDRNEELSTRFEKYLDEMNKPFGNIPICHQFIYSILGFLSQTLQILFTSAQYEMIPYIRYEVVFNYLSIIGGNFLDVPNMQEVMFKMAFANLYYKKFDCKLADGISFNKFYDLVSEINIVNRLEKMVAHKYEFNSTVFGNMNNLIDEVIEQIRQEVV